MSNKKRVNFIVTDLDDTIWDWLRMWYNSFEPYLNRISKEFNVDISTLKKDFKAIHQKYSSTEASFIHQELTCITQEQKNKFDKPNLNEKSILHEYYSLKKHNLFLYDGVKESLKKLKEKGVIIVGFTESNTFFTKYRIKHLELDGLIDYIYAPIDTGVPNSVYRHYNEDYWEPEITEIRYLSKGTIKPAPEILDIILRDFKAKKENTIYIGDKLDKDVSMANMAEIDSVYAKYGDKIDSDKYQLLRDVTHWTVEDVEREKLFKKQHNETPLAKYILEKSFDELFKLFDFFNFDSKLSTKNLSKVISIWEKTIDVQQHFNDIELRIRNIALTAFTFIIGGIGYLEKEQFSFTFNSIEIPYSTLLAIAGLIILIAFFYMDKYWYHRLLQGAVNHGSFIEQKWGKFLPEIKITQTIGEASPHKLLYIWNIHSKHKFRIFYGLLLVSLFALGIVLMIIRNCS